MLRTIDIPNYGRVQIRYHWKPEITRHDFELTVTQAGVFPVSFFVTRQQQHLNHQWCVEVAQQFVPQTRTAHQGQIDGAVASIAGEMYRISNDYHNNNNLSEQNRQVAQQQHQQMVQSNFRLGDNMGGQSRPNPYPVPGPHAHESFGQQWGGGRGQAQANPFMAVAHAYRQQEIAQQQLAQQRLE
jgi:hypothetical protein